MREGTVCRGGAGEGVRETVRVGEGVRDMTGLGEDDRNVVVMQTKCSGGRSTRKGGGRAILCLLR